MTKFLLLASCFFYICLNCNQGHCQWFGGFANMGYHASTVAEGQGNAISAVTRAKGQYQLDLSKARINNEQANAMAMENRKQLAKDYFETQAINKQARFGDYAERKQKHTQEAYLRYGSEGRPTRLNSSQLDPVTGEISWPVYLQADYFKKYTTKIDDAFVSRAETRTKFDFNTYQQVEKNVKGMKKELSSRMKEIGTNGYATSLQFVKKLNKEIKFATQAG